jgi:hypothetical protein
MKNKNILFITIGVVVLVLVTIVIVVMIGKKQPSTSGTTTPAGSTGTGSVSSVPGNTSTGSTASTSGNSTVTLGSGSVAVIAPHLNATQPYSTTTPRVEPKPSTASSNNTPLQSGTSGNSSSGSGSQVASAAANYNYNQSDSSFVQQYYPDAQQVISGDEGVAGNAKDDPADQIVFTTANGSSTGPNLAPVTGFDTNTLNISQDSSYSADLAYLNALKSATASFDIVNDTSYITQPLQDRSPSEASADVQQAQTILTAITNLTVPGNLVDVQASYVAVYQQYITYGSGLATFLNSSDAASVSLSESSLEGAAGALSQTIGIAIQNYQNANSFYTQ